MPDYFYQITDLNDNVKGEIRDKALTDLETAANVGKFIQISGNQTLTAADESVFIAIYGTTTASEVQAAINAGKLVMAMKSDGGSIALLCGIASTVYSFCYSAPNATANVGYPWFSMWTLNRSTNSWNTVHTTQVAKRENPDLTGTPTAPTAAAGTNTTQIATTAFVQNAIDNGLKGSFSFTGQGRDVVEGEAGILHLPDENDHTFSLGMTGYANEGDPDEEYILDSDLTFQPDPADPVYGFHWHTDAPISIYSSWGVYLGTTRTDSNKIATMGNISTKAPLASPAFTGNPTAPTQAAGNNSTRIATTAFVNTAITNANNIFIAEYGTTTYANISAAESAGKILFATRTNSGVTRCLPLIEKNSGGQYIFSGEYSGTNVYYTVNSSSNWSETTYALAAYSHSHTNYVTKAYTVGNASNYEVRYAKFLEDTSANSSVEPDAANKIIWFYE